MQIVPRKTITANTTSKPLFLFIGNDLLSPLARTDTTDISAYMLTFADLMPSLPGLKMITLNAARELAIALENIDDIGSASSDLLVNVIIDSASAEGVALGEHCHNVLDVLGARTNTTLILPFRFERDVEFGKSMALLQSLGNRATTPTLIAYPAPAIVSRGQERYFRQCRDALIVEHLAALIRMMTHRPPGDDEPTA